MRRNLHTHSFYCGHGNGTIAEYTRFAENNDFNLLGFTEHCPLPDERFSDSRMAFSKMKDYENDVNFEKANSTIDILLGYECDYLKEYKNYFEDLSNRVDYLVTGTHYIFTNSTMTSPFYGKMLKKELHSYARQVIDAIESNFFSILVHPDVFCHSYEPFDDEAVAVSKDIINACKEYNVALEVNGGRAFGPIIYGRRPYPHPSFWQLVNKEESLIVYNTDAHCPENLLKPMPVLEEFMSNFGFKQAEIESIKDGKINFKKALDN